MTKTTKTTQKPRKLSLKQRGFIDDLIKTKNGTQSALNNYNTTNENTAGVIASENIRKPIIRNELERRLRKNGLKLDDIILTHRRNLLQSKQLSVSQTAVQDGYKLYGIYKQGEEKSQIQVAFIINEKQEAIK